MVRTFYLFLLLFLIPPVELLAQKPDPYPRFDASALDETADLMGGGGGAAGGGGQASPTAYRGGGPLSRVTFGGSISSLGVGLQAGTTLSPRLDLRVFGNYLDLGHAWIDSGFNLKLKMELPNAGARVDFYPVRWLPLRISPGYLFVNQDQIRVDYRAQLGTVFTLNHIDWTSSDVDPVHGSGVLRIGGPGPMITAGLGRITGRSRRHVTLLFDAGAVFINRPLLTFGMSGEICESDQTHCQPAATFPTFASNLIQQVASWSRLASPFHVYPIAEFGVAYSFSLKRRRELE